MLMLQVCVQSYRRVLPSAEAKLQFVLLAGATCHPLCLKSHPSFFFFPVQGEWNLLRRQLLSNTKQSSSGKLCGNRCVPKCLILSYKRCPLLL